MLAFKFASCFKSPVQCLPQSPNVPQFSGYLPFSKTSANAEEIAGKAIRKLTLPPIVSNTSGTVAIEELLKACTPATFGKKGQEVLDESYRKAVKLDSDQFSTSFNPYEAGIIDAIAQSLLPGIAKPFSDGESKHEENLGVIAELYKLNVRLPKASTQMRQHRTTLVFATAG